MYYSPSLCVGVCMRCSSRRGRKGRKTENAKKKRKKRVRPLLHEVAVKCTSLTCMSVACISIVKGTCTSVVLWNVLWLFFCVCSSRGVSLRADVTPGRRRRRRSRWIVYGKPSNRRSSFSPRRRWYRHDSGADVTSEAEACDSITVWGETAVTEGGRN